MVSHRPVALGVPETDGPPLTGRVDEVILINERLARLHVDLRQEKLGSVVRKRIGPQELARRTIERPDATAFADVQRDVTRLAPWNIRVDPFDELRIGADGGPHQNSFVRVIHIPVVARQMLVIPNELAGIGIERHGRIAVKVRRRRKGNRSGVPAVTGRPGIRHRVGDAPDDQPPRRVISSCQSPR